MTSSTKQLDLPPDAMVRSAQQKLVNIALKAAVHMAYEAAAKQPGSKLRAIEIEGTGQHIGGDNSEQATYDILTRIVDDRDRVRVYNQMVKPGDDTPVTLDLSLKSAGAKKADRIKKKIERRGGHTRWQDVSDLARVMAVSGDPALLKQYEETVQKELESRFPARSADYLAQLKKNSEGKDDKKLGLEDWFCRPNARLQAVLKSRIWVDDSVEGMGAEIQFLPRHQARMANRITHVYYKAVRMLDKKDLPPESKQEFAARYNAIATWANGIHERVKDGLSFTQADVDDANKLLLTADHSSSTFDEEGLEGGHGSSHISGQAQDGQIRYSPIFKTPQDLQHYASQIHQFSKYEEEHATPDVVHGKKGDTLPPKTMPMPPLTMNDNLFVARHRLVRLTQLTNACYMAQAGPEMRDFYMGKVYEANAKATADRQPPPIPEAIIKMVPHTIHPEKAGGTHGR